MVEASPSALLDRTQDCATGLPSMIQDGSIGLGVKLTTRLVGSIRARDITDLKGLNSNRLGRHRVQLAEDRGQTNNNRLSFPYGYRCKKAPTGTPSNARSDLPRAFAPARRGARRYDPESCPPNPREH